MTLLRKIHVRPPSSGSTLFLAHTDSAFTRVGVAYSQVNTATGGTAPYTFAIVAGSAPLGCSLQSSGVVSGVPGNAGAFSYTVRVTDNVGATALAVSSGVIAASALTLTAGATSIIQIGAAYSQLNNAVGGAPPYAFTKSAGTLITGTTLNAGTGTVSGTVGGSPGAFSYTITVTDSVGATATATSSGTVLAAASGITALSPALVDVQAAVDAAKDGDTVHVPAGTAVWASPNNDQECLLIYNKMIRLVGAGMEDGGTRIIHDFQGQHHLFHIYPGAKTGFVEVTGFHFIGQYSGATIDYGYAQGTAFFIYGTDTGTWKNCRIHHNHFENFRLQTAIVYTNNCGCIDHNRFTGASNGFWIHGLDNAEWTQPQNLGTADWEFLEDNEWDFDDWNSRTGSYTEDLSVGGRLVFRYNTVMNGFCETHDKERNGLGGGAHYEYYNNYFTTTRADGLNKAIDIASGTGVIWGNAITGSNWSEAIGLIDSRSDTSRQLKPAVGRCDGTNILDGNTTDQGHICFQQVGSLGSSGAGLTQAPLYAWSNTLNGVTTLPSVTANDNGVLTLEHIRLGRDYFNSVKAGYTPYTYPHPLQSSGTAYGISYYVDSVSGSDSNTGKTSAVPWKNCPGMAAWTGSATLNPGDTVYFHKAGNWTLTGAQQGFYLTGGVAFIGDQYPHGNASARATLTGSGTKTAGVVFFRDDATYPTTFQGFNVNANNQASTGISMNLVNGATPGPLTGALKTIRNCIVHDVGGAAPADYTYGIIISDHVGGSGEVSNVLIENNVVHDIARDGLCLYPGDANATDIVRNTTVRNNEVYNCGMDPGYSRGSGIVVKGRVIDSVIENNSIHDISKGSGIFVNSNETNHYGTGTENLHIRNNIVSGNITQGSIRLYDGGGTDPRSVHIYGNICHSNTTGYGLHIGDQLSGAQTLRIYNNTFYNAPVTVSGVAGATFPVFEFKNNLVIQTDTRVPLVALASFTAHNNNVFRSAGATLVTQGGSFTAANLTTYEATALSSDPLFKNSASLPVGFNGIYGLIGTPTTTVFIMKPNTDGLSLQAGSPALNSGATLASPYTMSINSVTRTTFDRGAWEA